MLAFPSLRSGQAVSPVTSHGLSLGEAKWLQHGFKKPNKPNLHCLDAQGEIPRGAAPPGYELGAGFLCSRIATLVLVEYKQQRNHSSMGSRGMVELCRVCTHRFQVSFCLAWLSPASADATHATAATLLIILALAR